MKLLQNLNLIEGYYAFNDLVDLKFVRSDYLRGPSFEDQDRCLILFRSNLLTPLLLLPCPPLV